MLAANHVRASLTKNKKPNRINDIYYSIHIYYILHIIHQRTDIIECIVHFIKIYYKICTDTQASSNMHTDCNDGSFE